MNDGESESIPAEDATVQYGTKEYYQRIGSEGGKRTKQKYGKEHYERIGRLGGRPREK